MRQLQEIQRYSGFWGIFAVFCRIPETLLMRLEDGQTIVIVTHDTGVSERAKRFIYMKDGQI